PLPLLELPQASGTAGLSTRAAIATSLRTERAYHLAVPLPAALALAATLVVLDDGERIARDAANPLPPSPWPDEIALFAMRGETVAIQAVMESRARLNGIHATFGPFTRDAADSERLEVDVETFAEHFVFIARPSGNEREPGSLAFTADAAPDPPLSGWYADA